MVIFTLCATVIATLPVIAHEGDGTEGPDEFNDHHVDHMVMWWEDPTLLELIGAYLVLAIPIGLLVLMDAGQRGMNASMWFLLVLVPFFGMAAALAYLVIREQRHTVLHASPPRSPPRSPPPPPRYGGWAPQYDPWAPREEG